MNFTNEVRNINKSENELNHMNGICYSVSPLTKLKLITASSIFNEPKYYKDKCKDSVFKPNARTYDDLIMLDNMVNKSTSTIFEIIIDQALDYDFKATLDWAVELRHKYYMRTNPQVIIVRAAIHKNRAEFNKKNPNYFKEIAKKVLFRADDPSVQLTYYLYINKRKNKLPNILKEIWKERLNKANAYEVNKYKNHHIGIIDTIRICHANSSVIDKLMNENLVVTENNLTWEVLRSGGSSWSNILETIKLPHFALLKNLKNIMMEIKDSNYTKDILMQLEEGVIKSKLFPFRYYQAMKHIKTSNVNNKTLILTSLEACIDISLSNMPILKGRTACLSDNSGSCWGTFTSEYGSNTIAEINNLSSVIVASNSQFGEVIKFGDKIKTFPITSRNGILYQSSHISENRHDDVGGRTEHGIWLFFKNAISEKIIYNNIFIYSDQQAGHGELYGLGSSTYPAFTIDDSMYMDVLKMIKTYRKKVFNDVNVFIIQTAGYDNVVLPEYLYRTYILFGWTGKELVFAKMVSDLYD